MQAIGVLLLAAATAGDGFGYNAPGWASRNGCAPMWRPPATPPGAPPYTAASLAGGARRPCERTAVHQHQEPDLFPRPRRNADRLADRRPQRRTRLPARHSSSCRLATTSIRAISTG